MMDQLGSHCLFQPAPHLRMGLPDWRPCYHPHFSHLGVDWPALKEMFLNTPTLKKRKVFFVTTRHNDHLTCILLQSLSVLLSILLY